MKNQNIDNILSKIEESYISESCNFEAISEQFKKEKTRKIKTISTVFVFMLVCISTFGISQVNPIQNINPSSSENETATNSPATSETINTNKEQPTIADKEQPTNGNQEQPIIENNIFSVVPFKATKDDDTDSYGADEIHEVGIYLYGKTYYKQINPEDIKYYSLPSKINKTDLEKIGVVKELTKENNWDETLFDVSSKEPNIKGATVYYYKPDESKAIIVVQKGKNCNFFILSNLCYESQSYFKDYFELFNVKSSEDISEIIVYEWHGEYDETNTAIIKEKSITDRNKIKDFYSVIISEDSLAEIGESENHSYSASFIVKTKNGKILDNSGHKFAYYPYHGTGGVDYKGSITVEQNTILKEVFDIR